MLTSSANQYLRPEYLTPLPTTLDAKKSPLALLAQTCSQIGVDPPSGKSMLTSHDNKSSNSKSSNKSSTECTPSSREKSSPATSMYIPPTPSASSTSSTESTKSNSSFKPYESCLTESKSSSPEQQQRVSSVHSSSSSTSRSRTPATGNKRCSSNQSASSGGRAATPQGRKSSTPSEPRASPCSRPNDMSAAAAAVSSPSRPTASMAATTTTTSAAAYGLPYPPQLPPMDAMTASSLMSAQHHAALKSGLAHPYLSYARMKTPSGAETLVPVCRDPYCTGCQLNSHLFASSPNAAAAAHAHAAAAAAAAGKAGQTQTGPCPAGCAQCDHGKSSAVAAAVAASQSPYAAYAHAQLVALAAASQVPYVCNWIGSDAAYCGKRFATSDELLQHFRSHTGQPAPGGDANAAAAAAATTAAALSLLTPPGLTAGHPLLSRTYPTPPLSPLASARYHPYGKPHYGAPGLGGLGLALPPPPHALQAAAGLPPYFSPYSLYASSRLGAASGMHP